MQAGILTSGLQYLTRNLTATNIILEQSGHHLFVSAVEIQQPASNNKLIPNGSRLLEGAQHR